MCHFYFCYICVLPLLTEALTVFVGQLHSDYDDSLHHATTGVVMRYNQGAKETSKSIPLGQKNLDCGKESACG